MGDDILFVSDHKKAGKSLFDGFSEKSKDDARTPETVSPDFIFYIRSIKHAIFMA